MSDMTQAIIPKSDQLNSDDLIGQTLTIKITGVTVRGGQEQPVSIHFENDKGKPYKPCKSMCRVMVAAWGADSAKYVGHSMTLYRDEKVKWAGMEVGGIRISHMSGITEAMTMALTATKGSRKAYTVKPLAVAKEAAPNRPCITEEQALQLSAICADNGIQEQWLRSKAKVNAISEIAAEDFDRAIAALKAKVEANLPATQA